ncbi:MAG: DUF3291 domain-containing protein [Candidatus Acidiferrales bacterium]
MNGFFVSLTRLRVRSWRYFPFFFVQAIRSARQAKSAEGVLSVSLLREARNTFWTRTVWNDEQSMKRFMLSGPHGQVMRRLMEWCDEAAVAHWTQESPEPPSWEEAHRKLQELGRLSKVNHPSEAQRKNRFPPPRIQSMRELRFK